MRRRMLIPTYFNAGRRQKPRRPILEVVRIDQESDRSQMIRYLISESILAPTF